MKYTGLYSDRATPLIFLLLGIPGVYFGSFWWMLILLFLAIALGIFNTTISNDINYYLSKEEKYDLKIKKFINSLTYILISISVIYLYLSVPPISVIGIVIISGTFLAINHIWQNQENLKMISRNLKKISKNLPTL